jgi:hypothetical protein
MIRIVPSIPANMVYCTIIRLFIRLDASGIYQ